MKEKISLLLELEYNDYQAVIEELKEIQKGGTDYHYVIDTFDLINYCYPFGLKKEDEDAYAEMNKGIDYVADEQYALYQLFRSDHEKVILLDEYIPELYNFKRFIESALKHSIEIIDTIKKYEEEFLNRGALTDQHLDDLEAIVGTKLTLVLSISIDLLHKGIDKLVEVFRNRQILISTQEYADMGYDGILGTAFDEFRGSSLSENIEREIEKTNPIREEDLNRKNSRTIARARDIKVIDRIFSINQHLEQTVKEKKLKKRVVLLYLSSAQNTKNIFETQAVKKHLPVIDGKKLNPHRNHAQLFLKTLCIKSSDLNEAIRNVEYLRDRILSIKEFQNSMPVQVLRQDISSILRQKFAYYRENIESYAILSQYDKIKDLVQNVLKKLREQKQEDQLATRLIAVLDKVVEMGERQKQFNSISKLKLDNLENQIKVSLCVQEVLSTFESDRQRQFVMGNDHIMGSAHHLPLMYFTDNAQFKEIIDKISQIIIQPKLQESTSEIIAVMKSAYQDAVNMPPSLEERLINAFFLLLVPDTNTVADTNLLALEWVKEIMEKEILQPPNSDTPGVIESDYRFFLAWAQRRCKKYQESLDLLQESIERYPTDPRYYHGLSLAFYCQFEENKKLNKTKKIDLLNKSLANAYNALRLYGSITKTPIVHKSCNALLNTIAYLNTELYRITLPGTTDLIEQARTSLIKLKANEADYNTIPEYLHTEAYIELCEFKHIEDQLKLNTDDHTLFESGLSKLGFALTSIDASIEAVEKKALLRSAVRFNGLKEEIQKEQQLFIKSYGSPLP